MTAYLLLKNLQNQLRYFLSPQSAIFEVWYIESNEHETNYYLFQNVQLPCENNMLFEYKFSADIY